MRQAGEAFISTFVSQNYLSTNWGLQKQGGNTGGEEKGVCMFRAVIKINNVKAGLGYLLRARMSITKTLKVSAEFEPQCYFSERTVWSIEAW